MRFIPTFQRKNGKLLNLYKGTEKYWSSPSDKGADVGWWVNSIRWFKIWISEDKCLPGVAIWFSPAQLIWLSRNAAVPLSVFKKHNLHLNKVDVVIKCTAKRGHLHCDLLETLNPKSLNSKWIWNPFLARNTPLVVPSSGTVYQLYLCVTLHAPNFLEFSPLLYYALYF